MILASVIIVALLLSYPWLFLTFAAATYLVGLPVGRSYYRRLEAAHGEAEAEKVRQRAQKKATRTATKTRSAPAKNKKGG
jgi:hypothetical protein